MNYKEEALVLLSKGLSVIPVNKDKRPFFSWQEYSKRHPTKEEINNWWTIYPDANIAIITGKISNITVVDVEENGITNYLPKTLTVATGGGGFHFYYRYTPKFKNSVRIRELTDIRNDNGYVVAPPSLHASGNYYKWLDIAPVAEFPEHLFTTEILNERVKDHKKAKWDDLLHGISEGGRNDAAAKVCGLFFAKVEYSLWEEIAWPAVKEWNQKNQPPLDESELRATYESIARRCNYLEKDGERSIKSLADLTTEYIENPEQSKGVPTGFASIDTALNGGVRGGDLVIIGARPSVGKTSLALSMALNMAKEGKSVLFFSVEMSSIDVYHRLLAFESGIACSQIITREAKPEDLKAALNKIKEYPLNVAELTKSTSTEIISVVKEYLLENEVDVIVVDYLQFLTDKYDGNDAVRVGIISRNLKSLARVTNLPVVVPCQLNRKPEARVDKKPNLSDLRDSGNIEQDADIVFLLQRDIMDDNKKNTASLQIAKNRKGITGDFVLHFDTNTTQYTNPN